MKSLLIFSVLFCGGYAILYDAYRGCPVTRSRLQAFMEANITETCTVDIEPCDPEQGRRIGGSCNNLKYPSRGALHSPASRRMLPEWYSEGFEPAKAASGNDLPLARRLRTGLLQEGAVVDQELTSLVPDFALFIVEETLSNHDIRRYVLEKPYCCLPEGESDYECVPNLVPDDDPVHRFSNQRCINMTRPITFQSQGCTESGTTPVRNSFETPFWDLSILYGNTEEEFERFKTLEGGEIKTELVNGRIFPPSAQPGDAPICLLNQGPNETRCHDAPDPFTANSLFGINLFFIYFWRMHNVIAKELAAVNPGWSDEKIFITAKDINIAIELQLIYYELMAKLLGKENMEKDGVISSSGGFRDIYDENKVPELSLELPYGFRWFHTLQNGFVTLMDTDGNFLSEIPVVDMSLRTGLFADGDNMDYISQGAFRQGSGNFDQVVDPSIAERGLGPLQAMLDITTNDLSKGRFFGLQPYIKYRELCFGKKVTCWEDLLEVINAENLENLKKHYESFEDIDVLAGLWLEEPMPGSYAPPTFYCFTIDHMIKNVVTDRHWYERENRPNAFTLPQLNEIRKITIAGVMCSVGDSVTEIQPRAFERIGPNNQLTPCSEIPKIDYSKWKDASC